MRPARDVILMLHLEVILIEALRSTVGTEASPGLLRGLADARLVMALRKMHESPAASWTVAQLSKEEAGFSRSTFFERFSRAVGVGAHGVPALLAHGLGEKPTPAERGQHRRDRGACRLQLAEHVHRRVHPPCRIAADALRARAGQTDLESDSNLIPNEPAYGPGA